jgi:hypothetical protein
MSDSHDEDEELQFYYYGLFRALKRYRFATVLGWLIVVIGCASVPVGCNLVGTLSLIDLALSCSTLLSGLALVQQGISSLEAYITVPFPAGDAQREPRVWVHELIQLMKDVDDGGWQEAMAAIRRMKDMAATHGLPALN